MYNKKSEIKVIAEVSWWPIGWILAFSDEYEESLCDINYWSKFRFEEIKDVLIKMPCLWTITGYPMDFRNPEQLIKDRFKNIIEKNRILKNT